MPAAKPSQASIGNTIKAIIAAGLIPGAVRVDADGGFHVDIARDVTPATKAKDQPAANGNAISWEDVA